MSKSEKQQVIIHKKVKRDTVKQYYGGMWKVAYADFVTAMMAFFMLLWLLNVTPEETLKGVAKYFTSSASTSDKLGLGFDGGADTNVDEGIYAPHSSSSSLIYGSPSRGRRLSQADKSSMMSETEKQQFISIMNNIQHNVELQEFADNINVDFTNEGLRIQIMDSNNRPMFKPNTAELQNYMVKILSVIGKLLKNQPNYLSISGHTASLKSNSANQDSWQLSALRANEVRRVLVADLNPEQVVRIIGKADKEPFNAKDPFAAQNIRVDITLLNNWSISRYQQSLPERVLQRK